LIFSVGIDCDVRRPFVDPYLWVLATLPEAHFGLGEDKEAQRRVEEAYALAPARWMKDTTQRQLNGLRPLLADSPLRHLKQTTGQ
jgi:hypothetical protein